MSTEQRVISSKPKIGAKSSSSAVEEVEAPAKKGKGKLMGIVVGVLVLVIAGGAYWFLMGPGAASGAEGEAAVVEEPEPEPGEVLAIEAISINLAGGHYLRIGLGLQQTAEVAEELNPALALDHAIALYSGRTVEEVASAEGREALKAELLAELEEAYHHEVMDVYLMDYVTQ